MIIHISGASGSGKTTLGKKLEEHYGDKIIVVDMDDIMDSFISKYIQYIDTTKQFATKYQKFIDDYKEQLSQKHDIIIFVGLNAFVVGESHYYEDKSGVEKGFKLPKKYFDLKSDYNFYIELPAETIIEQTFYRGYDMHIDWFCKWMKDRKNIVYNELKKDEIKARKDISIAIGRLFDFTDIRKNIAKWNKFYKEKGYIFLSRDAIYDEILKIIDGQKGGSYYDTYLRYKNDYMSLEN